MIHRLSLVTALLVCCAAASADEDYSWCQGYIVKALGEFPVKGLSRVNLWLVWNEIVSETVVSNSLNQARYQTGRDHFSRLRDENNVQGIIDVAEQDCAVGRGPGWLWW
ncbi:MAG: hypothetical protein O7F73_02865 [Gammaproteobacteria bacterium]|nr:hypothetical protein [Gammaproteobacteria bacterium]